MSHRHCHGCRPHPYCLRLLNSVVIEVTSRPVGFLDIKFASKKLPIVARILTKRRFLQRLNVAGSGLLRGRVTTCRVCFLNPPGLFELFFFGGCWPHGLYSCNPECLSPLNSKCNRTWDFSSQFCMKKLVAWKQDQHETSCCYVLILLRGLEFTKQKHFLRPKRGVKRWLLMRIASFGFPKKKQRAFFRSGNLQDAIHLSRGKFV